ncbi:MAG: hypothetical protein WBF03_01775 [Xanthobacteraceae bacterium]
MAANREIELGEEEIADVSLVTFQIFDAENAAPRGRRLVPGGGGCGGGCACSKGCGS